MWILSIFCSTGISTKIILKKEEKKQVPSDININNRKKLIVLEQKYGYRRIFG